MPITQARLAQLAFAADAMRSKLDGLRALCLAACARPDSDVALAEIALAVQSSDYMPSSAHVACIVREQTHFALTRHSNARRAAAMARRRLEAGVVPREQTTTPDPFARAPATLPANANVAEWSAPTRFDDSEPDGDLGL